MVSFPHAFSGTFEWREKLLIAGEDLENSSRHYETHLSNTFGINKSTKNKILFSYCMGGSSLESSPFSRWILICRSSLGLHWQAISCVVIIFSVYAPLSLSQAAFILHSTRAAKWRSYSNVWENKKKWWQTTQRWKEVWQCVFKGTVGSMRKYTGSYVKWRCYYYMQRVVSLSYHRELRTASLPLPTPAVNAVTKEEFLNMHTFLCLDFICFQCNTKLTSELVHKALNDLALHSIEYGPTRPPRSSLAAMYPEYYAGRF